MKKLKTKYNIGVDPAAGKDYSAVIWFKKTKIGIEIIKIKRLS